MLRKPISFIFLSFSILFFLIPITAISAQKKFTIVIDAGHGGKDPGAHGSFSNEKDLNLSVALKLGEKIEKNNPDVKVLYTRKTDVYLTVAERPKYANDIHADLFISIHTNSSKSPDAFGAETFTLGVAKTQENLEVAMTENAVILLEDDYKQKYQGFDPTSIESYIMFEFMQDKYLEHSIQLASLVQDQFINYCKRKNRGVRQAGFLVLKNTAMPSILVEMGFISNPSEEKYLNSKSGQEQISTGIYNAFLAFKHEYDKKSMAAASSSIKTDPEQSSKPIYKVQIFAGKELLQDNDPSFKGLQHIGYYYENNLYKYTYAESDNYDDILKYKKEANKYFKGAFVVCFVNGKKVSKK